MKRKCIVLGLFVLLGWVCPAQADGGKATSPAIMKEIVVVATREPEKIIRVPGNVTVITSDDIKQSSARDLTDLLKVESGLMVTNTSGSTPTGINVETRGFNNGGGNGGRTLVLIDGWKANQADSSNPDWALIPIGNIDRIEVIRGPATAVYGDSAMAGVINIITKKGAGKPTINFGVDVGSWQRFGEETTLQGSTNGLSYFLYGDHVDEDGYRDNSNFRAKNFEGKFTYELTSAIELNLKTSYHSDDRELPGALTQSDIDSVGRRGSVASGDERETDQYNIGVGADIVPDDFNKISILFHFNNNQRSSLTSIPGAGSNSLDDDEDDKNLTLRYTSNYSIFDKENKAIIGVDLYKENVDSKSNANFPDPFFPFIQRVKTNYERRILGVYFHDDFSILDKVTLGTGVRFDRAIFEFANKTEDLVSGLTSLTNGSKDFNRLSPKASITVFLTDKISSYLSYARSFRYPNRDELTGFFGLTPELKPEKGTNYEIGMKAHVGQIFKGGISFYYMKVEDEILFKAPNVGDFTFGQNENFDEVMHKGIEVSAETNVCPRTTLFGNYTFVNTEIKKGPFNGSQTPITPRHMGNIGSHIDLGHDLTFWNQVRFVGNRFLTNDLSNSINKLPGYGVWDTKLTYSHKTKRGVLTAFLGINNILDKEYEEFGGVGGFPFGSRVGFNPSPERSYIVGINLSL